MHHGLLDPPLLSTGLFFDTLLEYLDELEVKDTAVAVIAETSVTDAETHTRESRQRREQRMQLEGVLRHSLEIDKVTEVGLGLPDIAVG